MGSKAGLNTDTMTFNVSLTSVTDDTAILLCTLDKDYMEVSNFTVAHQTAGVGAQNIAYFIKTTPSGTITPFTAVSAVSGNAANATQGASASGLGNGLNQTALVENRNLWLDVNFAAAVTSGPLIGVVVALRK